MQLSRFNFDAALIDGLCIPYCCRQPTTVSFDKYSMANHSIWNLKRFHRSVIKSNDRGLVRCFWLGQSILLKNINWRRPIFMVKTKYDGDYVDMILKFRLVICSAWEIQIQWLPHNIELWPEACSEEVLMENEVPVLRALGWGNLKVIWNICLLVKTPHSRHLIAHPFKLNWNWECIAIKSTWTLRLFIICSNFLARISNISHTSIVMMCFSSKELCSRPYSTPSMAWI